MVEEDSVREERITMEIVVDAYGLEEQAMGWYYYLQDKITFPFTASCITKRRSSPNQDRGNNRGGKDGSRRGM